MLRTGMISRYGGEVPAAPLDPPPGTPLAWFDPASVTGKSDGDTVAQLDDGSGNARHLAQATGSKQPLYKTGIQNGKPSLRFDGIDDALSYLEGSAFITSFELTLVIAYKRLSTITNGRAMVCQNGTNTNDYDNIQSWVFDSENGSGPQCYRNAGLSFQTAPANGTAQLFVAWFDGGNNHLRYNGAPATSTPQATSGNFSIRRLVLGAGWVGSALSNPSNIDFLGATLYGSDVGSTMRGDIETYYNGKLAIF